MITAEQIMAGKLATSTRHFEVPSVGKILLHRLPAVEEAKAREGAMWRTLFGFVSFPFRVKLFKGCDAECKFAFRSFVLGFGLRETTKTSPLRLLCVISVADSTF